jgi:hypothetical protein
LKDENRRLKHTVADLSRDKEATWAQGIVTPVPGLLHGLDGHEKNIFIARTMPAVAI